MRAASNLYRKALFLINVVSNLYREAPLIIYVVSSPYREVLFLINVISNLYRKSASIIKVGWNYRNYWYLLFDISIAYSIALPGLSREWC